MLIRFLSFSAYSAYPFAVFGSPSCTGSWAKSRHGTSQVGFAPFLGPSGTQSVAHRSLVSYQEMHHTSKPTTSLRCRNKLLPMATLSHPQRYYSSFPSTMEPKLVAQLPYHCVLVSSNYTAIMTPLIPSAIAAFGPLRPGQHGSCSLFQDSMDLSCFLTEAVPHFRPCHKIHDD